MAESSYTYYDGRVLRSKEEGQIEEENAAKILSAKKLINLEFKTKEVPYSAETVDYPAGRSYSGFHNQYYVDIFSTFELKMEALKQHKSQIKKYSDDFLAAVEARARFRGYEIGNKYVECFEVLRLLGEI